MYKNYYLFKCQVEQIKPAILGSAIREVFTFRKNELIISTTEPYLFIMLSVDVTYPYILIKPGVTVRKSKFRIFEQVVNQEILDLRIIPFDKKVHIETQDFLIDARFYGTSPNIALQDKTGRILDTFKDSIFEEERVENFAFDLFHIPPDKFKSMIINEPEQKIYAFLKRRIAALNERLLDEILYRADLNHEMKLMELLPPVAERLLGILQEIQNEIHCTACFLYDENTQIRTLSIIQLHSFETKNAINKTVFQNLNEAWALFIKSKTEEQNFRKIYALCMQALTKRMDYLQKSLAHLKSMQDLRNLKATAELKGNLLLINKHRIKPGLNEVELENIFSETSDIIKIRLNPKKTVAENSAQYFMKYKDIDKQKMIYDIRKNTFDDELKKINDLRNRIQNTKDLPALLRIYKTLERMHLLQTAASGDTKDENSLRYSFNRLILDKEWDVYIGKNGENNELLTFRFANKWDIWLHAQGVPGSHVVIRLPRKNAMPPVRILEHAAQIAAAHSKAKHSSTVPVIYTQVRYVCRMRKALPGTVSVKNEKVIFVEPLKI